MDASRASISSMGRKVSMRRNCGGDGRCEDVTHLGRARLGSKHGAQVRHNPLPTQPASPSP